MLKEISLIGMNIVLISGPLSAGEVPSLTRTDDELQEAFSNPPVSARPWTYWWWMNGAASKEGITRDFEEMREKGIAGVMLMHSGHVPEKWQKGPAFMSDEWRELFRHTLREADRCGIGISVNVSAGWNCGGPWVTDEHAMKKLVCTETVVKGHDGQIQIQLPKVTAHESYRDIAVMAAPIPDVSSPVISASSQYENYGPELTLDGDPATRWVSPGNKPGLGPTPEKPEFLQLSYEKPREVAGVYLKPYPDSSPKEIEVQCSEDGGTWRSLKRMTLEAGKDVNVEFQSVQAKHFRVVFLSSYPFQGANWNVQVAEIKMLPESELEKRAKLWDHKAAIDLSGFVNKDGLLDWKAPDGCWKVLRIGYSITGKHAWSDGAGPGGLEIDPLSAEAMDMHFAETGAKLVEDAGPLTGKVLRYLHIDSWEAGIQDWTPKMPEEFRQRRGYDLLTFLPAVLGHHLVDAESGERFMQDFRRTVADLMAENFYGRLSDLAKQAGMLGTDSESGGPGVPWVDALECLGKEAVPMGEFWTRLYEPDGPVTLYGYNSTIKRAAAAAHIYGKPISQAEAFTSLACNFSKYPWVLKDLGDWAFCEGMNRIVFHQWVHQLQPERKPGVHWEHIGITLGHSRVWWPMSEGWLGYLTRCQYMLQQGLFVADFAYLQSERIPAFSPTQPHQLPAGFDYDPMNAEVLLERATAKNKRLTLPDGMSYAYLVLPYEPQALLTPKTLAKVNELAESGVPVIGPGHFAPSVPLLRQEDGPAAGPHKDGLLPDIEFGNLAADAKLDWIHRRDGETDIYFLSNQSPNLEQDVTADITFRVAGKQPELWDPVTGKIRDLDVWQVKDGRTAVSLRFAPRQSWFVVFRRSAAPPEKSGVPNFPEIELAQEINGPWQVQFDPKWFYPTDGLSGDAAKGLVTFETLEDFSTRKEPAIQYYSGIAVYRKTFSIDQELGIGGADLSLSLGKVANMARVRLNGQELGIVWTAPWQVAIPKGLLKRSGNELEIEIANCWPNRLIGDDLLPEAQRRAVTNVTTYNRTLTDDQLVPTSQWARSYCFKCNPRKLNKTAPELMPSGLLGPVRLMAPALAQTE